MSLSREKNGLLATVFIVTFLTSFIANSTQAKESTSASVSESYGEITLVWNHVFSAPSILEFSEVNVNAETYEQGLAVAQAVAKSSTTAGDSGSVSTVVATESITTGLNGLADAEGIAQNFFLLKNTSNRNIKVSFDWSVEWLVEGEIENPESDQAKTELYIVLQKKKVRFNNAAALAERIAHNISERINHEVSLTSIFAEFVSTRLPPVLSFYDSDSVADEFTIHFGPGTTYLFVLSAELRSLASISLGGCPPSYWRKQNDWPIDPHERFFDVFGAGPEHITLNHALWLTHSNEGILMSNAVAALLNATSSEVSYYTNDVDAIKAQIQTTYETGDFELTNAEMEYYNNIGYPLVCE